MVPLVGQTCTEEGSGMIKTPTLLISAVIHVALGLHRFDYPSPHDWSGIDYLSALSGSTIRRQVDQVHFKFKIVGQNVRMGPQRCWRGRLGRSVSHCFSLTHPTFRPATVSCRGRSIGVISDHTSIGRPTVERIRSSVGLPCFV